MNQINSTPTDVVAGKNFPGLAVLNPGGRDPDQSFAVSDLDEAVDAHAPINYHGYAACTEGGFYRNTELAARHESVLLLLRNNLEPARRAIEVLKTRGCFIAISFKESGAHQVADLLSRPKRFGTFREIAAAADLCISSTPDLVPLYSAVSKRTVFIPTPYPVDLRSWNFALPAENRKGILIGTREFDVPSRNHFMALAAARTLSVPVTVVNPSGKFGLRKLASLNFPASQLKIVSPLNYTEYLKLMAAHRFVLQFDQSSVPGQVAGDTTLCRIPMLGGNGAIERLAYPDLNSHGRGFDELMELAQRLLKDNQFYEEQIAKAESLAQERLAFSVIREELRRLLPGITRSSSFATLERSA
jgi:hypothetical protein